MKALDWRRLVLLLLAVLLSAMVAGSAMAAEAIPIRLVSLISQDDQGESIEFPNWVYYDYWASETYLISSNSRITIYDQKFFPVASFGQGRGLGSAYGVAVDRRGNIYVCQDVAGPNSDRARLTIFNPAFFVIKEIIFARIPELADFTAVKVAVAESGDIYLVGQSSTEALAGVAVLTPEGKFLRILRPPEKSAWRPKKKTSPAEAKDNEKSPAPQPGLDSGNDAAGAPAIPEGLKPKPSSRPQDDEEDKGEMEFPYIVDVKIDRQGRIYLLSREVSNVYVFNANEEYLFKFGEKGGAAGKLSNPVSLGIDLERRVIYVCDYMRHSILCYDYDGGRFIFEFGGQGVGPLWFNFPNSVDVDQRGRVIVSDLFNRRLQVIDPNIGERRPLAGKLDDLAPGMRPNAEAVGPAATPLEIVAPGAAGLLAPVVMAGVPGMVAVRSLPAPAPPTPLAPLAAPVGGQLPLGILSPSLPALMTGVVLTPLRAPMAAGHKPPARSPLLPERELVPRHLKKKVVAAGPPRQPLIITPVLPPPMVPQPAAVRSTKERGGEALSRGVTDEPPGILARFRAMPAAVGVYGPVAALVGIGSWLLYTNH